MKDFYSLTEVADMLGVSKNTLRRWDNNGKLKAVRNPINNYRVYPRDSLRQFEELNFIFQSSVREQPQPAEDFRVIELFAGAGGLALGLEEAGLKTMFLNDIDKDCCETLRHNRPGWNVECGDIAQIDFKPFRGQADVITGGFPCQAFSYAGKKLGFKDTRGSLFYEFARAVDEAQPKLCLAENVRGLISHDGGRTLDTMVRVFGEIGYKPIAPRLLKAMFYRVPQKRERVFVAAIRKDIFEVADLMWPQPYNRIYNLADALKRGDLYDCDVPDSDGQSYPERKKEIMDLIPPGGYWRDLPVALQKEYMKGSYYLGGGKTGIARRISWEEPCLTLTCAPAMKQTERCHPDETRPFAVREYARIQTFPDNWEFKGTQTSQYKQIGNAVPVNFAFEVGKSIVAFLNQSLEMQPLERRPLLLREQAELRL